MATPPDRMKMRNNPVNGKKKKKRKVTNRTVKGIRADQPATPQATTQATPRVAGTPQALLQTFTTKTPYRGKTTVAGVQTKKRAQRLKQKIKKVLKRNKNKKIEDVTLKDITNVG